ncbi:ATP-binding domain-containing protein, partial [Enterococcus sp. S181_ASV_20]|nr:ATP-binding domain-containing protein [Enterococcus sp. S181_ASV_20]
TQPTSSAASDVYKRQIVTTTQFAKGLEFDQVILPDIRSSQLTQKSTLLYTSCSRALHELTLLINDGKDFQ